MMRREASWTTVALGVACGFLVGVLLVVALGVGRADEPKARTVTVASKAPPLTGNETVITKTAVPDVVGQRLDTAHKWLEQQKFIVKEEGGGLFGTIIDSDWEVKSQEPAAGTLLEQGATVTIHLQRR
jgi:beta-lactam-binding protein with PASTA domain